MALMIDNQAGAIDEIAKIFGLSDTALARLFDVSRQALAKWRRNGVPLSRGADVDRLLEVARVFKARLKAERIPQIVLTPAKGLGGKTVLGVLEGDGVEPVFRYLHRLYSYSDA